MTIKKVKTGHDNSNSMNGVYESCDSCDNCTGKGCVIGSCTTIYKIYKKSRCVNVFRSLEEAEKYVNNKN